MEGYDPNIQTTERIRGLMGRSCLVEQASQALRIWRLLEGGDFGCLTGA